MLLVGVDVLEGGIQQDEYTRVKVHGDRNAFKLGSLVRGHWWENQAAWDGKCAILDVVCMRDWAVLNVLKDSSYLILVECHVPRKSFAASSCDSLIWEPCSKLEYQTNHSFYPCLFTSFSVCIPIFIPTIYFRGFQQFSSKFQPNLHVHSHSLLSHQSRLPRRSKMDLSNGSPGTCSQWSKKVWHMAWHGAIQKRAPNLWATRNDMGRPGINRHCATTYDLQ